MPTKRKPKRLLVEVRREREWIGTRPVLMWVVRVDGLRSCTFHHQTIAIVHARDVCVQLSPRPCELKVRRRDGKWSKIAETYPRSSDPRASRG